MKISVVTPSFRQLDWLYLCAASIADQIPTDSSPSPPFEIQHIIQDGLTDGMDRWAKQFTSSKAHLKSYKLQVFSEKDDGMYDAINRGLRHATGDICCYLNCDEQYLPGTLARVVDFFNSNHDVDVLFGDAVLINTEGMPLSYRRMVAPTLFHLQVAPLNTLTCSTFFRRSVLDKGHFFPTNLKISGDQLWVYRMLKAGIHVAVLNKPLSVFTFTGQNLSQTEQALYESDKWLPESERTVPKWFKGPTVVWHRLEKLIVGAYFKRSFSMSIYTKDSPLTRKSFQAQDIGFAWPA